jgi:hypothetical protein
VRVRVIAVLLLVMFGGSCRVAGKQQDHRQVGASGETLRAAFNADVGKTRVLVLLSPT